MWIFIFLPNFQLNFHFFSCIYICEGLVLTLILPLDLSNVHLIWILLSINDMGFWRGGCVFVLLTEFFVMHQRLMFFYGETRRYPHRHSELRPLYGFCLNCLSTTSWLWFATSWSLLWRGCSCGPMHPLSSTSKVLIL